MLVVPYGAVTHYWPAFPDGSGNLHKPLAWSAFARHY